MMIIPVWVFFGLLWGCIWGIGGLMLVFFYYSHRENSEVRMQRMETLAYNAVESLQERHSYTTRRDWQ